MGCFAFIAKEFSLGIHLSLLLMCVQSKTGTFIETPMSVNVTNSNGTEAEFHCVANGTTVSWKINGSTLLKTRTSFDFPGGGVVVSTVFIPSDITFNNAEIVCQVLTTEEGVVNRSHPAVLRIQGPPAAVLNIASEFFNGQVCLTWTPPFTLDLTGVDVDIHYDIIITSSRLEHRLNCTQCPLVLPKYCFPENLSSLDPCGVYSFSVVAFNDAGRGPGQLLSDVHTQKPIFSDVPELEVVVNPALKFIVNVLNTENVCIATVNFNSVDTHPVRGDMIDGQWQFIPDTDSGVKLNAFYSVVLTASNAGGSDDREITLSTYDLQEAKIEDGSEPGSISVTDIKFAINSSAVGFLAVIVNESGFAEHFEVFMKSNSVSPAVELDEGLYHVTLYDVEDNGEPQTSAAISATIAVPQWEALQSSGELNKVSYRNDTDGIFCITCSFGSDHEFQESLGCVVIIYSNDKPNSIHYYTEIQASKICPPMSAVTAVSVAVFRITSRNGSMMINNLPNELMHFGHSGPPPENNTTLTIIIGTALGSFFTAVSLVVFFLVLIVCIWKKHNGRRKTSEIVLQSNQVYDVVKQQQWSRSKVVQLEPCSAYGMHRDVDASASDPEYVEIVL